MKFLFGWSLFFGGFSASNALVGLEQGDAERVAVHALVLCVHAILGTVASRHVFSTDRS